MSASLKHPGLNLEGSDVEAHTDAERVVFGFWLFLMSDLIVFGLLFATYATMLTPAGFANGPTPTSSFNIGSVFAQTLLLLTSSYTFGRATLALKHEDTAQVSAWLLATLLLGCAFLTLEAHDLLGMIAQGAVPQRSGWLSAFFSLIALHGGHVALASVCIVLVLMQLHIIGPTPRIKTRILRLGLFWHMLDVIWIGIFSLVFLGGLT